MLRKMYYLLVHLLLWPSLAAALPQVVSQSSQVSLTAAASPTRSPTIQNTTSTSTTLQTSTPTDSAANVSSHKCNFDSMQNFFDYSAERGLDITIEVQNCQNLCLLVYGVGNPDLSGIGVSVFVRRSHRMNRTDMLSEDDGCLHTPNNPHYPLRSSVSHAISPRITEVRQEGSS